MPWLSPAQVIEGYAPLEKLSQLTNEPRQQAAIDSGDGAVVRFTTPFFRSTSVTPYVADVESTGFTLSKGTGENGEDEIVFDVAPADGAAIAAKCVGGVNVNVLNKALLRGQQRIRGPVDAALYTVPADDATDVPGTILEWAWDITAFMLATDIRRTGLLTAEIQARYDAVAGPIGSLLSKLAKGEFSLRGILPYRGEAVSEDGSVSGFYVSSPRVYTGNGSF